MKHKVICINRQCGSGGARIGQLIAEKLNIPYYDRNLLPLALERGGMDNSKYFQNLKDIDNTDEPIHNRAFYKNYDTLNSVLGMELSAPDIVFQFQSEIIMEKAQESDCVIVGRCANRVLNPEQVDFLSVFIGAPLKERAEKIAAEADIPFADARSFAKKIDKLRSDYYYYYTDKNWTKPENYDLYISTSKLTEKACAEMLAAWFTATEASDQNQ